MAQFSGAKCNRVLAWYVPLQQFFAYLYFSEYGGRLLGHVRGKTECCFAERKPVEGLQMRSRVRTQVKSTRVNLAQVGAVPGGVIARVGCVIKIFCRHEERAGGAVPLLQVGKRDRMVERFACVNIMTQQQSALETVRNGMDENERVNVGFVNRAEEHSENISRGRENIGPFRFRLVV